MSRAPAVVSYLEMREPPAVVPPPPPCAAVAYRHQIAINVDFYQELQREIGSEYRWGERVFMDKVVLQSHIHHPGVKIFLLEVGGAVAGFCELDGRQSPTVEIRYFGLRPPFIGRGLGRYFLSQMVLEAWRFEPRPIRVWLHTDSNDHPRALAVYRSAGFRIFREESESLKSFG